MIVYHVTQPIRESTYLTVIAYANQVTTVPLRLISVSNVINPALNALEIASIAVLHAIQPIPQDKF